MSGGGPPEAALVGVAVLFGLTVGSFLNVCIHRLPWGRSVVAPRSSCPRCRQQLAWHDNVPLLSYLWLGGRCRCCQLPISPLYPSIEAANGLLYGALVLVHGTGPAVVVSAVFASAMLALIVIDAQHQILPDVITLPGIVVGLVCSLAGLTGVSIRDSVLGAALGWGLPWAIAEGYRLLRGKVGMGMGDLKMLAMVGAFLGWQGVVFALAVGSTLGAVTGVPYAWIRGMGMQAALPFGTFLGLAALADLFGGRTLVESWLRLTR